MRSFRLDFDVETVLSGVKDNITGSRRLFAIGSEGPSQIRGVPATKCAATAPVIEGRVAPRYGALAAFLNEMAYFGVERAKTASAHETCCKLACSTPNKLG